tara:strand:- start:28 stop:459 length:432 start_codon:yes stop_codon:yes gene_type:complete
MVYCSNCGTEIVPDGANFCSSCGQKTLANSMPHPTLPSQPDTRTGPTTTPGPDTTPVVKIRRYAKQWEFDANGHGKTSFGKAIPFTTRDAADDYIQMNDYVHRNWTTFLKQKAHQFECKAHINCESRKLAVCLLFISINMLLV